MKKNIIKVLRIKTKKKKVKIAFVPASAIFVFLTFSNFLHKI
ncbi:hypothetical protein [Fusobacterium animalis]